MPEFIHAQSEKLYIHFAYSNVIYPFYSYEDYKNTGSYKLDANLTYYINSRFGISTGLEYELKKFLVNYEGNNLNGWEIDKVKFEFDYVNIPLLAEISLFETKSNTVSARTGIEFGNLASKKIIKLFYNEQVIDSCDDYKLDRFINNLSVGLAYRYHINNYFVLVYPMLRYNIANSQGIHGSAGQGTALSYVFKFAVGYKIGKSSQ